MKITSPEDFWSGVMFISFGAVAIFIAQDYPLGSAMRMGPGYFPTGIGLGLIALGAIIAVERVQSERRGHRQLPMAGDPFSRCGLRFLRVGHRPSRIHSRPRDPDLPRVARGQGVPLEGDCESWRSF